MITAWQTDTGRFASSEEVVPWWSVTKTVIATACLRLAQKGQLDLNARLKGRAFCVADLLAHRAGVASYTGWAEYHRAVDAGGAAWRDDAVLAKAEAAGADFEVGAGWSYSNTGYLIVRRIVEEVTSQPIERALQDLVFAPLGLHSARIARTEADLVGCKWLDGAGYDPKWVYHGLAVGTAAEACQFLHGIRAEGFLNPARFAQMTDRIDLGGPIDGRPWQTAGYGLGLMIGDMAEIGQAMGHSGNGPQSVCALYTMRAKNGLMTAAAFSDDDTEDACEWRVQQMVMSYG
ncbi:serine hydrolase domain-containing protein [Amylibacter sp. IMCC11727]|uniref:serine hydrolase domain-containing protein n=1 Tax=Amylibacter sp. IMCC11727 TaxID=3039851 RepID=UPI00244E1227|nr:serine hydrolase domain-containing protein [Amylibacter sp. IMCC11727]WGI22573.1 serine hydrolase [Amylibacter sp. IMCC11727]